MKEPAQGTVFAGVNGCTDAELPAWYAEQTPVDEPASFAEAIRVLPRAVETRVAYQNPYVAEWIETDRFNAIVEPSRLRDQALVGEPDADPLFHVPSNSYTILNPVHVYEPLEEILREETLDGRPLGEVVFGEIRQYRSGGEVHMDVLFDGLEVTLPDRENEPIMMGLTSGYDFFGSHAVYVEGLLDRLHDHDGPPCVVTLDEVDQLEDKETPIRTQSDAGLLADPHRERSR